MGISGVISFTLQSPYPWGKNPRCPLNWRLGGLQNLSGRSGVGIHLCLCTESNASRNLVTTLTELQRLYHNDIT
jgi:hypothetical protein